MGEVMTTHRITKAIIPLILLVSTLLTPMISLIAVGQEIPIPLPPGVTAKRGDILIVENHYGTFTDPDNFNYLIPGRPGFGASGFSQVCAGFLWYINTTNSELINWLAASPPEYSSDYKTMTIYLRKGLYWNDGHPFTADDVVFTINLYKNTPGLVTNPAYKEWIDRVEKVDDYTVKIYLSKPSPKLHIILFTVTIYGGPSNVILPKHVWEGQDPLKFKFYPPVCIGPYNLKAIDPGGNWFLWERYEDWWGTKLYGMKPGPKYVLFLHPGPEEKKALAMVNHQLDCIRTFLPENFDIVWKNNPYLGGYYGMKAPYAFPYDACVKGIAFNVLKYPFNITEVRRALTFAINFEKIYEAFKGPDGSLPVPAALPVVPTPLAVELYYKPLEGELVKLGYDPETKWWKYDPQLAEQLLTSVGFRRGPDGKWLLPNGEKWKITITAPSGFEMESQRIAFLVADQWRAFGIDVDVAPVESGPFSTAWSRGEFEVGAFWPGCSLLSDLTLHINWWARKYFDPGAPSVGWSDYNFSKKAELDKIIDEMEMLPSTDPKVIELGRQALLIWAEQLPWVGFFPTPFYTVNDNYVWTNWPYYPDNYYMDPVYWWAQMLFIILRLQPTGRVDHLYPNEPGTPPTSSWPPIEAPTTTTPGTPAGTVTVTRTIITTTTTAVTTPVTVPTLDTTTVTVVAIIALIIGLAVGWVIARRR